MESYSYDAFISYKHGEIDNLAARTLQTQLEHFHVSKKISKDRKPFKRIFLDDGELSSHMNFNEDIRQALEHSKWLIVICSTATLP